MRVSLKSPNIWFEELHIYILFLIVAPCESHTFSLRRKRTSLQGGNSIDILYGCECEKREHLCAVEVYWYLICVCEKISCLISKCCKYMYLLCSLSFFFSKKNSLIFFWVFNIHWQWILVHFEGFAGNRFLVYWSAKEKENNKQSGGGTYWPFDSHYNLGVLSKTSRLCHVQLFD